MSVSVNNWYNEFYLDMEVKTLTMGKDVDDNPSFTPPMKLLALLHAEGQRNSILTRARYEMT